MKKNYILSLCLILFLSINEINAQTEWTGSMTTFTKTNNADWTLEVNQDRITSNVWITRANNQSIFNISDANDTTAGNCSGSSPLDTEWAFGTIEDGVGTLTFGTFLGSSFIACNFGNNGVNLVNIDAVLHLITDDIYIDIKFLSWSSGGSGGGFSYQRSTNQTLSINEIELDNGIKLFPNPSTDFIQISGLNKVEKYTIYNIIGSEINKGIISNDDEIDVQNLTNGLYFLKFEDGNTIKFTKE
jgi:hypothetical protein